MPAFTPAAIDDVFSYHAPRPDQISQYNAIREAARVLARVIIQNTPASPDQTVAIRKLRECVMVANAAVALDGKF